MGEKTPENPEEILKKIGEHTNKIKGFKRPLEEQLIIDPQNAYEKHDEYLLLVKSRHALIEEYLKAVK